MKSRLHIGHWILLFALAALPFAATFALSYPDERHYTDGALQMLRDHDWLVPKTPENGTTNWLPRFHKPPLAYWVTAASFAAFGVNVLAARLPFLLAGCGTIFLTWRLARKLSGSPGTALLAAVILSSHVQFILAATRSIPDALLFFFVTLSAFGFLRLIVFGEFVAGAFWLAYGGAAGAAMSKGMLGACIVLFAWAFALVRERKFSAVRKLIHVPSLALAAALVLAWFAYIFHRYGMAAWQGFFSDQVTDNIHGNRFAPLWRAPVFALVLALNFLPWSLPALEAWWRGKGALSGNGMSPVARKFILAWAGTLVVVFALGVNVSVRYLLPAAPLLAILVADVLAGVPVVSLIISVRRILLFLLLALVLLTVLAGILNAQWGFTAMQFLVVGLFFVAVAMLGWGVLRSGWFSPAEGLGLALLLAFPLLFFAAHSILLPDPGGQMAATLRQMRINSASPVLFVGGPAMSSRVRLFLGGKCNLVRVAKLDPSRVADYAAVFLPAADAAALSSRGFVLLPAAVIAGAPPAGEWWSALRHRQLPELLERHGRIYMLAIPGS